MDPINVPGIPADEPQTSGSAETIRLLPLHVAARLNIAVTSSTPPSPRLSPPGSPHSSFPSPSSPSGESVSSLPSVSSSFLFSGPGSPPHLGLHHGPQGHELGDSSLIIPSLTLPAAVRRPTPYGQTLGEVRVLVLGYAGAGAEEVAQVFAEEECEDVVEVGQWEEAELGADEPVRAKVLRLSTDWIEHRDAHGLEKHEPSRNVEVVLLQDYGPDGDLSEVLRSALAVVHAPFSALVPVLHPDQSPNALLASLLASPASPLYTAMAVVPSHHMTQYEHKLISELSTHVPLVVLPSLQASSSLARTYITHQSPYSRRPSLQGLNIGPYDTLRGAKLASICPHSAHALRTHLLRSPEALSTLRLEAAERFMRWREVERAVGHVLGDTTPPSDRESTERTPIVSRGEGPGKRKRTTVAQRWSKARWEEEWEGGLATDVAKTLRARRVKGMERRSTVRGPARPRLTPLCTDVGVGTMNSPVCEDTPSSAAHFDPLHLPSLLAFSFSLLGPLKARIAQMFTPTRANTAVAGVGGTTGSSRGHVDAGGMTWALVGVFCAGVGMGVLLSRTM